MDYRGKVKAIDHPLHALHGCMDAPFDHAIKLGIRGADSRFLDYGALLLTDPPFENGCKRTAVGTRACYSIC